MAKRGEWVFIGILYCERIVEIKLAEEDTSQVSTRRDFLFVILDEEGIYQSMTKKYIYKGKFWYSRLKIWIT